MNPITLSKLLFTCLLFISLGAQAETAIDECLLGNWKTDPAHQKKSFEHLTGQHISNIKGAVFMRINANGNGKYQLKKIQITATAAESGEISVQLNGISHFTWRTVNNNFSAESTDAAIQASATAKIGEMVIPLPSVPFNNGQWPAGRGQARYVCTPKQLQFNLEHNDQLINILWQRI